MTRFVTLSTPSGKLNGTVERSCLGDDYYAFRGLPYAQPPIGELRFCDPKPIEPWTGVREATNFGLRSLQFDYGTRKCIGSEDCLYLNVYTRSTEPTSRAPVMFWVHGGAFVAGNGEDELFGPDYLIAKSVVLVTINYRLGVFGFLNLEDALAAGNQGLKDQAMALRWVHSHIASFGGDPDNVTVFGGSAGASSTHLLAMSPWSKGLFHKIICQSGSALSPWTIKREPMKSVREFLDVLNYEGVDRPEAILDFLRNIDSGRLIEAQQMLKTPLNNILITNAFGPCVDEKSSCPFLPVHPLVAVQEGIQVPVMAGYNNTEWIIVHSLLPAVYGKNIEDLFTENSNKYCMQFYNLTIRDVWKHYAGDDKITDDNVMKLLEMWGDLNFANIHAIAKYQCHIGSAPTYVYKLTFDNNETLTKSRPNPSLKGVNHGDELCYLFKAKSYEDKGLEQLAKGSGADRLMRQMTELWSNFARTGRPTVAASELIPIYWQHLDSPDVLRFMDIGKELRMKKMLNFEHQYPSRRPY